MKPGDTNSETVLAPVNPGIFLIWEFSLEKLQVSADTIACDRRNFEFSPVPKSRIVNLHGAVARSCNGTHAGYHTLRWFAR